MVAPLSNRRPALIRLVAATVGSAAVALALVSGIISTSSARITPSSGPVPKAHCGPGARPETDIQGRVPTRDYTSGRSARGYRCNTRPLSHFGHSGGFKVHRYVDPLGHVCAYYDSTLLFPTDVPINLGSEGVGTVVLNMKDPRHPVRTATLSTPAMDSPHESLLLNQRRGLLAAVMGSPATALGIVDIYDVHTDCRHPRLLSSSPTAILGHESGFAPDGRTFYTTATTGLLTALDVSNPRLPLPIFTQLGVEYHGLRLSNDGNTMFVANIGLPDGQVISTGGLRILDVSEIQQRKPNPQVHVLSDLRWPNASIAQVAEPMTIGRHHYLLETDEFANFRTDLSLLTYQPDAKVGAARIINIDNLRRPFVVSNIRLQVHQPKFRDGPEGKDPGASFQVQGYAGHYCSIPRRHNPGLAACSMIASGLRLFDIRDPRHPKEVGYFNKPLAPGVKAGHEGAWAMSQPAWDWKHRQVWYTDANSGFYAVKLTNGIVRR